MVTFTAYGRADQVQISLLLRLNCKLLIMPSDAAGFSANGNLGNASLPLCFLLQLSPHAITGPPSTGFELDWPHTALSLNKRMSIILWVPNTQTRNPNIFPGPFFLFFLKGIYFLTWNGQYLGLYSIHKTERERGRGEPTSCTLLFYFIWGKMFYARPSESKTQGYYSTHSCFNHFSPNNGEKMWFYKQTGRKSLNTPREHV